jgi:hypothetical protein
MSPAGRIDRRAEGGQIVGDIIDAIARQFQQRARRFGAGLPRDRVIAGGIAWRAEPAIAARGAPADAPAFDQRDRMPAPRQLQGDGESGEAAADHGGSDRDRAVEIGMLSPIHARVRIVAIDVIAHCRRTIVAERSSNVVPATGGELESRQPCRVTPHPTTPPGSFDPGVVLLAKPSYPSPARGEEEACFAEIAR